MTVLACEGVTQTFAGRTVLDGLDVRIERGACVALVGPSGAGKTTIFRLVYGAFAPTSGRVLVGPFAAGEAAVDPGRCDAKTLRALRARTGVILQSHGLVDRLSVRANVLAGTFGRGGTFEALRTVMRPSAAQIAIARDALARVGLEDRIDDRVFELSGGERQRVAVARTIAQGAELVLADEPAASLDADRAHDIVSLLLGDARARGATLICTLHQRELTNGFDRTIELRDGKVVTALTAA